MSRNIWVISDTHFGHENIIKYCNRPFSNAKEMNEAIKENWNSVVKPNDIVYHLGDVVCGWKSGLSAEDFLKSLNGKKRLILGNHDNGKDKNLLYSHEKIMMWRMFPEFGLILSHVPLRTDSFRYKCDVNVHGHIHQNLVLDVDGNEDKQYKNVCVEHTNYRPINIEELRNK